jgi:hypothetical protein
MIIRPVGAKFIYVDNGRTDGRTAMTKLKVAFRNFVNAPVKRYTVIYSYTSTVLNEGGWVRQNTTVVGSYLLV